MTEPEPSGSRPASTPVKVLKFGGTSLGSGERILASAALVLEEADHPVVVVSAMSGVTDLLTGPGSEAVDVRAIRERHLRTAREILSEGPARDRLEEALQRRIDRLPPPGSPEPGAADERIAAGEDLSALLMAAALNRLSGETGRRATVVDTRSVVRTDDRFGQALPRDDETVELARRHLLPLVSAGEIPVLQGFVGATDGGRTTTLGRGGSDFTAAILGAALEAPEVTIWTDVDGIFTADPNRVPGARVLPELGYEEAVELAYFGARVVHPAAAKHAVGRRVALRIRNSFRPEAPGTLIRIDRRRAPGVAALAFKPSVALLTVRSRPHFMAYGFLARVFEILARNAVPVDLVATSHTSTALTVDRSASLETVRRDLEGFAEVELRSDVGTVSAIGAGLLAVPGVTAGIFRILDDVPVHLISQATDTSLSFVVDEARGIEVIRRLHASLLEPDDDRARPAQPAARRAPPPPTPPPGADP